MILLLIDTTTLKLKLPNDRVNKRLTIEQRTDIPRFCRVGSYADLSVEEKFIERGRGSGWNLWRIISQRFVHRLHGYLGRTIGDDPSAVFGVSSDLPRGVIPRLIVRAALELPRHRNTANGIHLHNYLLAGSPWRPVAHRFTARCSLTSSFFKIRFSTGFLTSRPSYFFARVFFICPVYRFLFSNAASFSPERSHPRS